MVPYKRPAADKSGVPVYQPNATTYQQLMQLQQPYVPVSCEYSVSPTPTPATTTASPPATETQAIPTTPQQQTQLPKDTAEVSQTSTTQAQTVPLPSIPPPQIPDPAALAKEVAQQNYAKAVKLAAVSQSYANSLNPLNYTGVSLNKQAMTMPPPSLARYPVNFGLGTAAGLGLGIANPYTIPQANLLNLTRPPPSALINPYSFIRSPYATAASPQSFGAGLLGTQYLPVSVAATPITNVPATTQIAAAAAQNNNNNVVLQPYKKLKTT